MTANSQSYTKPRFGGAFFLDQHQPHPSTHSVAFTQQMVSFRTDFSKWLIYNGKVESGNESTDL